MYIEADQGSDDYIDVDEPGKEIIYSFVILFHAYECYLKVLVIDERCIVLQALDIWMLRCIY